MPIILSLALCIMDIHSTSMGDLGLHIYLLGFVWLSYLFGAFFGYGSGVVDEVSKTNPVSDSVYRVVEKKFLGGIEWRLILEAVSGNIITTRVKTTTLPQTPYVVLWKSQYAEDKDSWDVSDWPPKGPPAETKTEKETAKKD